MSIHDQPTPSLDDFRSQIDELDSELLRVLAQRMYYVREIGKLKQSGGMSPLQQERFAAIIKSQLAKAKSLNLSEKFVDDLYQLIHEYALEIQREEK